MDAIPIGALTNGIGVVGVVLLVFWMISRGTLHTDREWQQLVASHLRELQDVAHDRDEWRTESRIKDQQIDEQSLQLRALTEVGTTMQAVLQALHSLARSGGSKEPTP